MTDKEFVISIYPNAYVISSNIWQSFSIFANTVNDTSRSIHKLSSPYSTLESAWQDAAERLRYKIHQKLES